MHEPKEIARAFLIESEVDYRLAQLLRGTEFHSRTISFAQQAVEKIVKACLALRGVTTIDHNLSSMFRALYRSEFPEIEELAKHIDALERHGARTRFPLYQRDDLPLWIPSRSYREADAVRALQGSEYVVQRLKPYLERILEG